MHIEKSICLTEKLLSSDMKRLVLQVGIRDSRIELDSELLESIGEYGFFDIVFWSGSEYLNRPGKSSAGYAAKRTESRTCEIREVRIFFAVRSIIHFYDNGFLSFPYLHERVERYVAGCGRIKRLGKRISVCCASSLKTIGVVGDIGTSDFRDIFMIVGGSGTRGFESIHIRHRIFVTRLKQSYLFFEHFLVSFLESLVDSHKSISEVYFLLLDEFFRIGIE